MALIGAGWKSIGGGGFVVGVDDVSIGFWKDIKA